MPTTAQLSEIVNRVKARLADAEREGVHLKVSSHKLDDDWLYIVVEPAEAGVRASDHANLMSSGWERKELATQQSVDSAVWSICDVMRRGNVASALQYVPELTWILFQRILAEAERLAGASARNWPRSKALPAALLREAFGAGQ